MSGLETQLTELGVLFALILTRVGAVVATAPILSDTTLPVRVKGLMAVSLAAMVTPVTLQTMTTPLPSTNSLVELGMLAVSEAAVGLALGLGLMVVLAGVQLCGQIVGQMSGMALAEGADPVFGDTASVFGQIYYLVTTAVLTVKLRVAEARAPVAGLMLVAAAAAVYATALGLEALANGSVGKVPAPPIFMFAVVGGIAALLDAELRPMGSAGAKAMAVVAGEADLYYHSGGQHEWDNCAPAAVALGAGLRASRVDGAPLVYNRRDTCIPDLLIARPDLADRVLRFCGQR